jgi:hypothetical protein
MKKILVLNGSRAAARFKEEKQNRVDTRQVQTPKKIVLFPPGNRKTKNGGGGGFRRKWK